MYVCMNNNCYKKMSLNNCATSVQDTQESLSMNF